jgi:transposase
MEKRETITLDSRAQQRLYVLNHILAGDLSAAEAGRVLTLSERQVRRLLKRYRAAGAAGLVHGNHERAPGHRTGDELRARLVELATTTYAGVNRAHLAELLAEREGVHVPERTLRRVLAEAAVAPVRTRRPGRHRQRRERMGREGQMVQTDGSRHQWFGPEQPFATLVGVVDDATGKITGATFRAAEDAAGYFTAFAQTAADYGLPGAVYSDRHGIFMAAPNRTPTIAEQLTGRRSLTQVGRALDTLAVAWIGAHSAQGKGRVERTWGTIQGRLVVELRLETITTIEDANAFLPSYIVRHNTRFAVPAADPEPAWRPWPAGLTAESVFCFHYHRRVARDATLSWAGVDLALPRRADGRSWAGRTVTVQERLDGSLWVSHEGSAMHLQTAPTSPSTLRARKLSDRGAGTPDPAHPETRPTPPTTSPPTPWRPAPDHPWRRYADRSR